MICLSCTGRTITEDLTQIEKYRKYIDLAEVRADYLDESELDLLGLLPEKAGIPCLLAFRRPGDGGVNNSLSEGLRYQFLLKAASGGYDFLDLEDDLDPFAEKELLSAAEKNGTRIIKSFHDFNGVPADLLERMRLNSGAGRFIPKAAVMPESTADFLTVMEAFSKLKELDKFILIGMGPFGFPARILGPALGSFLTYSSAENAEAAPGHITPEMLVEVYRTDSLSRDSRLFGIIGRPVMHTKSPDIHNAWLQSAGIDGVYLPFETDNPKLLLSRPDLLKLNGLSVTIPHKQRVIDLADNLDEAVTEIGACNTLVSEKKGGGWKGYNTDWKGFLSPLTEEDLEGGRALVIGAGGAARAVVYALVKSGMKVTVINRTREKAEAIAADFGCAAAGLEDVSGGAEAPYLVVQTTSVGMSPDIHGNPVPGMDFSGVKIVYDLIYTPEKTEFLKAAEAAGCRIINGGPMLRAQAVEQFRLFTGREVS